MREPDPAHAAGGARAPPPAARGGCTRVAHHASLRLRLEARGGRGRALSTDFHCSSSRISRRWAVLAFGLAGRVLLECDRCELRPTVAVVVAISDAAVAVAPAVAIAAPAISPAVADALADAAPAGARARAGRLAAQRAGAPPHDAHRHRPRARPRRMRAPHFTSDFDLLISDLKLSTSTNHNSQSKYSSVHTRILVQYSGHFTT